MLIAGFCAVTEEAVVAEVVLCHVEDSISLLITNVDGAGDAVIKAGRCSWLAATVSVTGFDAIAEEPIITAAVDGLVADVAGRIVTEIHGASDAVINDGSVSIKATALCITGLNAAAILPVVTDAVDGGVDDLVGLLITGVLCAVNTVINRERSTCDATLVEVA